MTYGRTITEFSVSAPVRLPRLRASRARRGKPLLLHLGPVALAGIAVVAESRPPVPPLAVCQSRALAAGISFDLADWLHEARARGIADA